MSIEWTALALLDLEEISDFYAAKAGEDEATRITDKLVAEIEDFSTKPLLRRVDTQLDIDEPGEYYFWLILGNKYRVYFSRLDPDTIEVYRILSGRRPPLKPEDIVPK